jgi:hypothetical protein
MKVMREIGLDLSDAPRQQITPKLTQDMERIISFLPRTDLPEWLQDDDRITVWHVGNYPASNLTAVRSQRDEIIKKVRKLTKMH